MEEKEIKKSQAEELQTADIVDTINENIISKEQPEVEIITETSVEEKLQQAEAEIAELKDKQLRQAADFANFRKHSIAKQTELILNGGKKVLESLLPILDDMERAEANMAENTEIEAIKEGLSLIFQKLEKTLEQHGLKKMKIAEMDFDTDFHEAVALFPVQEEKKDKIIDCVQTGYLLNDKVLRHAKVVVGQ